MRRLLMLLALLSSGVIAIVAPAPVGAATTVVEPEPVARIFTAPTSPQTTGPDGEVPWGLDRIDQRTTIGDNSFAFSNLGSGVDVYVVDTGINATHPEFDARVQDGWSYRADPTSLAAYKTSRLANDSDPTTGISACASNPTTQQFAPSVYDSPVSVDTADKGKVDNNGHGTHVAGSVGGNTTGVAKGVNLIPVRVLDSCGNGNRTMIDSGLTWILNDHVVGEPAVVNLSLGFPEIVDEVDQLISELMNEGVVVVAAAGNISLNDNSDLGDACGTTPAGTLGTISVGSSNEQDIESSFSYYGRCVDIFAPGDSIISAWPKNGSINTYVPDTGTSMAAPHIAGAVARFMQGATTTSSTPAAAWSWLKLNATCNAISYYTPTGGQPSRVNRPKTPNRLLAIDAPATRPCAPASMTATANNGSATIAWDPVVAENGAATLDYTVVLNPGNRSCTRIPTQTLSCVFTGLTSGIAYFASVHARNEIGDGVVLSDSTDPGLPNAVTNIAGIVNENAIDVSWVKGAGDDIGVTYTVSATPGGASCTTTSTTCSLDGLTLGTEYTISVVGENSLGFGATSSIVVNFVRPPLAVTNLAANVINNAFEVSWDLPLGDVGRTTYTATVLPGGAQCTSTSSTCSITGLTVGYEYQITVVGSNTTGAGAAASVVKTFSRAPLAVTNLVAKAADNSLDISWEKGTGEAEGTRYVATATPGNFTCTSTSTTCSIASLVNGSRYIISVSGVNAYGSGTAVTAQGSPDGVPDVPELVNSVVSKRTVTLSWPAITTTADVTYIISTRPGNVTCTTELNTCQLTGLSYGVNYSIILTSLSSTGLANSVVLTSAARPGFNVRKSVVKRGSSTLLTNLLTPLSTGKRTWTETGPCSIRGTKLVAPKKITKCILILKVAKRGSYPAMSTRLTVSVN